SSLLILAMVQAQPSSYAPVDIKESFQSIFQRYTAQKPAVMKKAMDLLADRYDLSDRPDPTAKMFRGKPLQDGVRVKLASGTTFDQLAQLSPDDIKNKDLFPQGFMPLPHTNHPEGGMVFPRFHIDEINRQEGRDLTRFDLDFDIPEHFLPEFPPPIFL